MPACAFGLSYATSPVRHLKSTGGREPISPGSSLISCWESCQMILPCRSKINRGEPRLPRETGRPLCCHGPASHPQHGQRCAAIKPAALLAIAVAHQHRDDTCSCPCAATRAHPRRVLQHGARQRRGLTPITSIIVSLGLLEWSLNGALIHIMHSHRPRRHLLASQLHRSLLLRRWLSPSASAS